MNRKRVLAIFVVLAMVALVPLSAFAESRYISEPSEVDAFAQENGDEVELYVDEIPNIISESVREIEEPALGNVSARGVLNDSNRNIILEQAFERSQASSLQAASGQTPSLYVTSMEPNSVTFNVTFPISGRWGNVVALDNHNVAQPYLYNNVNPWNGSYYMANGSYTFTGLVPGGFYYLNMMWSTDGSYYGGSNSYYCGFQLPYNTPENLVRTNGTYVYTDVESADKSLSTLANFTTWMNRLDQSYTALRDLTGFTPYGGDKIGIKSSRLMSASDYRNGNNYWYLTYATAGNPVTYYRPFLRSLMQRLSSNDWSRGAIHELSHDFDKPAWEFDPDVLADFKSYYVIETLGAKVYPEDAEKYYVGSAYSEYFKTDHKLWSYSRNFANGNYTSYGMVWLLINIKNQIGWQHFKSAFAYLGNLSNSSSSSIEKFNLFMTKLRDYSGYDVLSKLSTNDKLVISSHFGGLVNYITGDSYEPNNSTAQATSILSNATITNANLHTSSDVDYYKFTLNGNYSVSIELSNIPSGCDYDLQLYNSSNSLLSAPRFTANLSEKISISLSAGTYYIKILPFMGSSNSNYRLQITTSAKTTLVLIPGGMGSRLYYNGSKKWEPTALDLPTFENSMKPFLLANENGVPNYTLSYTRKANDYGAQDVFTVMYNYLTNTTNFPSSHYNVKFFTYDWRLGCAENANRLASELANDSKVVLIAHSMGGLIASSYLAKGQSYRDKVDKLITFGTPYTGSAKAIKAFETGQILGGISDVAMAGHMKDISANLTSAYELLPTARYGDSYLANVVLLSSGNFLQTNYNHPAARIFFASRPWARKANGSIKPMLADSEAFHNSLMVGYSHIAEDFGKSYYIYGTGEATPSQAVYAMDYGMYLSCYEVSSGDGTVIAQSARNNRTSNAAKTKSIAADHTDLVKNRDALDYMKSIIIGTASNVAASISNNGLSIGEEITEEEGIDCISVVIQGVQDLKIIDADGSELVQDGETIYRQNSDGSLTEIGSIWLLDAERQRYQYVLDPGEYQLDDIELDSSIRSEVLVMSFENDRYISKTLYNNITPEEIQIDVSFGESTLTEKATMDEILPSQIASVQEIQELNEGRGLSN